MSTGTRARKAAIVGAGATESSAGVASMSAVGDVPLVSLADGDSKQVTVVQQSVRSVDSAADASAGWEQHGIRLQKPMIAVAGARPAMIRTIARASGFRCISIRDG